jgi:hypothetical protein
VPPSELRAVTVGYLGFDGRPHRGTLVVNVDAVGAVRSAFRDLRRARFPIRRMLPVTAYGASDHRSVQHDNTSAFNCRFAVASGPKHWSEHAYGEAIDVDPRENPYVQPGSSRAGTKYADRSNIRRGMIIADGPVVRAFDATGWGWGGRWSAPDYQHFSVNGH